ncbi:cupin domain-containing protein [Candidatus Latescibacterota bacterium]
MKFIIIITTAILIATPLKAEQTGEPYVGRPNYENLRLSGKIHGGAGSMKLGSLVSGRLLSTPLIYIHYGQIMPNSGIGEHEHPSMEEMFFSFNAPAEFTQDGNTALLPAGSFVPCKLGGSHGIFNRSASDTLMWLNIGIVEEKGGRGGAKDFGQDLTDRKPGSPDALLWGNFDKSKLKPVANMHGGKGNVQYCRILGSENFKTNWEYIDHVLLPPGTSIGYHQLNATEEVYYILKGHGRVTVNDYTFDASPYEAYPCTLHDSHGIYNNTNTDMELFILGIAMQKGVVDTKDLGDDLSKR